MRIYTVYIRMSVLSGRIYTESATYGIRFTYVGATYVKTYV